MKFIWLLASTSRSRAAFGTVVVGVVVTTVFVLHEVQISGVSITARAMLAILFVDFELVMRCSPFRARVVIVVFFSIIQNVLKVKRLSKGEKVKGERV